MLVMNTWWRTLKSVAEENHNRETTFLKLKILPSIVLNGGSGYHLAYKIIPPVAFWKDRVGIFSLSLTHANIHMRLMLMPYLDTYQKKMMA